MDVTDEYYAVLGVKPDADDTALRRAYRSLIRRHHPDVNLSADAAGRSSMINEAYACLRDPIKRAAYDRQARIRRAPSGTVPVPRPTQTFRPSWGAQHADLTDMEAFVQSRRRRAASLVLAAIATIVTFTITSDIRPIGSSDGHQGVERTE